MKLGILSICIAAEFVKDWFDSKIVLTISKYIHD